MYERISSVSECLSFMVGMSMFVYKCPRKHVPDFKNVHVEVKV